MADFVSGTILEIRAGAVYDGMIWDCFLKLQLPNERDLDIFDPSAIATNLRVGGTYKVVLIATNMASITVSPSRKLSKPNIWRGVVSDPNWLPPAEPEKSFICHSPDLYVYVGGRIGYVLMQTTVGNILMSMREVEQMTHATIKEGTTLQWKDPRMDLYAVLEEEDSALLTPQARD